MAKKNDELLASLLAKLRARSENTTNPTAENKTSAEDGYKSYYDELRLAAQQQQDAVSNGMGAQTASEKTNALVNTLGGQKTTTPLTEVEPVQVTPLEPRQTDPALTAMYEQIVADYKNRPVYTAKTREEMQEQAENEYASQYEKLRLAAQQGAERSDLALQQQRAGLQDTYDREREASGKEYQKVYSQADRQLLGRGMQRSSYGAQTLANIDKAGAEAQQRLWDQQAAAEGNVDAQRAQLAQQLADQLTQYDTARASDVLARVRQLEDQEYQRQQNDQTQRSQLGMQLTSLLQEADRAKASDEQWRKTYDFNAQKWADQLAENQYQRQYQQARDAVKDKQWAQELELQREKLYNSGNGYSSGGSYSSGSSGGYSSGYRSSASKYYDDLFDAQRAVSLAGIRDGTLKANESPMTTLGSAEAANKYYSPRVYAQMQAKGYYQNSSKKNTKTTATTTATQQQQPGSGASSFADLMTKVNGGSSVATPAVATPAAVTSAPVSANSNFLAAVLQKDLLKNKTK